MKLFLATISLSLATGCGIIKQQMCGPLDLAAGCHAFFGDDTDRLNEADHRIGSLEERVSSLESEVARQLITLDFLLASQTDSDTALASLQTDILLLYAETAFLLQELSEITPVVINNYNNTYVTNITNVNDVRVIDPCPSVSSSEPREYILKLGDVFVAYMESGPGNSNNKNRYLTALSLGVTYRTTDSRECSFIL